METATANARLIGLGVINDGMDWLVENIFDLTVLRQKARDLDRVIARMDLIQDGKRAEESDLNKWLKPARQKIVMNKSDMVALLSDDDPANDADAEVIQVEQARLTVQITKREEKLATVVADIQANQETITFLRLRLAAVNEKVLELEEAKSDTKNLDQAASAIEATQDILEETNDFDNVGTRILRKRGQAEQRFARVTSTVRNMAGQDTEVASAKAEVARMKAEIARKKAKKTS